jgi:hypothetical protein
VRLPDYVISVGHGMLVGIVADVRTDSLYVADNSATSIHKFLLSSGTYFGTLANTRAHSFPFRSLSTDQFGRLVIAHENVNWAIEFFNTVAGPNIADPLNITAFVTQPK